jgi:hypothetical protein
MYDIECMFLSFKGDVPRSFLMDSIVSPNVKRMEGEGIGVCSLIHSTLRVEGCDRAPRWD